MSTLQELVRYCSEDDHLGALLLTGEWGCGKTHLIEKDLSEALKETHLIVRVSLLGLDSSEELNNAIRKQWFLMCTPFLGKLNQSKDQLKRGFSILSAIGNILKSLNPLTANVASAIVTADPLEYVPLEPIVEDHLGTGEKKRVVLVFDDVNRSKLDLDKIVGIINEYCENRGFRTIVIADEQIIKATTNVNAAIYKMVREKTIARTVLYVPDYPTILHDIITGNNWPSQEYAVFLLGNEQMISDLFASDPLEEMDTLGKCHNIRTLIGSLREFSRIFEVLVKNRIPDMDRYLYAFITYMLILKNGIFRDGQPWFEFGEEDVRQLYPGYSSDTLPESILQWVEYGVWDEEQIAKDLSAGTVAEEPACPPDGAPADPETAGEP